MALFQPGSRFGLGLAALGRPGYINLGHGQDIGDTQVEAMERRAHQVLDAALAAGVRYVDAARSYGRAEQFLASWLAARNLPPGAIAAGSKWGYVYTANWQVQAERHEVKDHSAETLRRQLSESRALLGPWLRLYQIHSLTPDSGALEDSAVLEELCALRESGVIVGVTSSGPRQAETLKRALAVRAGGSALFGCVQATWNLHEQSCAPALAAAHDAGVAVIVKEALANGRLARTPPPALTAAARARSTTPDAVALAAALSQPWADLILLGASTVDQLAQNLAATRVSLEGDGLRALQAELREEPRSYWERRSRLAWT